MTSADHLEARPAAPGRGGPAATAALLVGDDERTRFWACGKGITTAAEFALVSRWPREMSARVG
jgi:hypothetical protein